MRRLLLIVCGISVFAFIAWQVIDNFAERRAQQQVLALSQSMKKSFHVDVAIYKPDSTFMYDPSLSGTAPDQKMVLEILHEVRKALSLYPTGFLEKNLLRVVLVGTLKIEGGRVGGSYLINDRGNEIFLSTDYVLSNESRAFARRTIHHEFSSILMMLHDFPFKQWRSYWPSDIVEPTDREDILKYANIYLSQQKVDALKAKGFVSDYGLAGAENDVNTYVELLFDDPSRLRQLAEDHELIAKKLRILLSFYASLHPDLRALFISGPLKPFVPAY
nr:hypothetical protein [uncultured Cohaesibacter sp.]